MDKSKTNRPTIIANKTSLSNLYNAIPSYAFKCLQTLEKGGYEAWFVGGFVRDSLLKRPINDVDISTQAPWQETKRLCLDAGFVVYETGTDHGTVSVVIDNHVIEVTTYRIESGYYDHRHPSSIQKAHSIVEDLGRRDFTINALAFHPEHGIVDPFGGIDDLNHQIIRCVGNPTIRLSEDALRIIRAIRFCSQLGFSLEKQTSQVIFNRKQDLNLVAGERLKKELEHFLCGQYARSTLMEFVDVLAVILPELKAMKGLDQRTHYHCFDVLEHTAYVIEFVPKTDVLGRWAALFHDMGKPETFSVDEAGVGHMYGHEAASVGYLSKAAYRLRFPSKMTHNLKLLVRYHDFRPNVSRKNVRKLYSMLEYQDTLFPTICNLMRADALAHAPEYHSRTIAIDELEALFNLMKQNNEALCINDLDINGSDLIDLGLEQGPEIGEALDIIFKAVANEEIPNEHTKLIDYARFIIASRFKK